MSTLEVATKFVELVKAGKLEEVYTQFYSPEIVSVEANGQEGVGLEAIHAKNAWWESSFEIHSWETEGPFPGVDAFAVIYTLDITEKASGKRSTMREVAYYTLKDGKVVREEFLYPSE